MQLPWWFQGSSVKHRFAGNHSHSNSVKWFLKNKLRYAWFTSRYYHFPHGFYPRESLSIIESLSLSDDFQRSFTKQALDVLPRDCVAPILSVVNTTFYLDKNKLRILLVSCTFVCISFFAALKTAFVVTYLQVYYTKLLLECVS